jgi:hypothetical protein
MAGQVVFLSRNRRVEDQFRLWPLILLCERPAQTFAESRCPLATMQQRVRGSVTQPGEDFLVAERQSESVKVVRDADEMHRPYRLLLHCGFIP